MYLGISHVALEGIYAIASAETVANTLAVYIVSVTGDGFNFCL
ncbi:hypothetical protein [Nostoc sp. C110]